MNNNLIKTIRNTKNIDADKEKELIKKAQQGDQKAADQIIEANLKHALNFAIKYRHYNIPVSDLFSAGAIGIIDSLYKFDPKKDVRFMTYASYWIRAYVMDVVIHKSPLVGGGSGPFRSKIYFKLKREQARASSITPNLEKQHQIIAEQLSMSQEKIEKLLQRLNSKPLSLDKKIHSDQDISLIDTIESKNADPETSMINEDEKRHMKKQIAFAMKTLDEREKIIIEKRHFEDKNISLAALGRLLGISRERARQLEMRAKKKLEIKLLEFAPA